MKKINKLINMVLFAGTVLVWGIVVRHLIMFTSNKYSLSQKQDLHYEKNQTMNLIDTVHLFLKYPDPFLKSLPISNKRHSTKTTKRETVPLFKKKETFSWPKMKYMGYIISSENKCKIGILMFNDQTILLKEGETKLEITAIKILNNSILLSYRHKTKTLIKYNNGENL